ncbi:class I tRNA ligase family protein, partial [Cutibacterium acnes subsp. acnes]|nr:class I tRNA ligase family protein [Cutibacterium acnes subsp. acnes]
LTGVTDGGVSVGFSTAIAVWLWLTVIFANLAESIAEGRGKAQAESLRKTRTATSAIRVDGWDERNDPSAEHTTTTEVVSSEFLTMSGSKFSSSKGVVIYVKDFLEEFGPDPLRYFIAVAGP